jgi:hypothetical protein
MFRNQQKNNQKSKNHDTLVWSVYVKCEGNVLTHFGCRFFQLCGCTSEWWCYCGWRELHREIPKGERALAMHAGPISKWLIKYQKVMKQTYHSRGVGWTHKWILQPFREPCLQWLH